MPYIGPAPSGTFGTGAKDRFSGDASTVAFTMSQSVGNVNDIDVFVDNVRQEPTISYTVSATTLTFTAAPDSGTNNVYVVHKANAASLTPPDNIALKPSSVDATGNIDSDGDIFGATLNADGDTSAGDNAAIGFTSTEGLILTGQGSTNDVTIKNDADTAVIQIPTGGTAVSVAGILTAGAGSIGMGPAFAASAASGQSAPSNNTFTKVVFGTETFDTDGKFATNRFTPTVIGYYQINGGVSYANANYTAQGAIIAIYKNGSSILAQATTVGGFEARHGLHVSGLVYLDADDYVELFIYGPNQALDAGTETFFNGAMVRKA